MLSFMEYTSKRLLAEGGNLQGIDPDTGKVVSSSPISLSKRKTLMPHIRGIVNSVRSSIGHEPVPENDFHKVMVGSSEHFHNTAIDDKNFKLAGKKEFGDQDVLLPNSDKDVERTVKALQPGNVHNGWKAVHSSPAVGGKGVSTLFKHPEHGVIQVDFNHAEHGTDGLPTRAERFSKSSPAEDLFPKEPGGISLKGFAHKYAVSSLTKAIGSPVMLQTKKGLKPGISDYKFAVSALGGGGIRKGTEAVIDPKTKKPQIDPESGKEIHLELPSKGAERISDPKQIARTIIGKKATPQDESDIESMRGVHRILKRHYQPEVHNSYIHHTLNKLYGHETGDVAQQITRHDFEGGREADNKVKDNIVGEIRKTFPEHFTPEMEDHISNMKNNYNQTIAAKGPRKIKEMKEETKKKPKTPEQEFYGYKSNPKKKGPSQLGNVSHDVLTNLAAKYFGPNVVNDKKLNEMKCPSGIKKIRYKGTLGGKDMMVCPRRSGSSSGGNGGNGN